MIYDWCNDFSEGLATVCIDDKWGYINNNGETAISLDYDWVDDFVNGYAVIAINDKYGFVDKTGTIVLEPKYDNVNDYGEGLFTVKRWKMGISKQ